MKIAKLFRWGVTGLIAAAACGCGSARPTASSTAIPSISSTRSGLLPPPGGGTTILVTVPDVVGQVYYETGKMTLGGANLVGTYRLEKSATVVAGTVISQTPAAGSIVPSGTFVTSVVSIGPSNIPGAQPCKARHLMVQRGPPVSEATGQHTTDWSFTNLGAPCVLDGYPVASALDKDGRVLGYTYTHSGDQMTTGEAPQPVYLPRGSAAWISTNKYRCDIAASDNATTLRLSMPSGGGTLDVPATFDYCAESPSLTIAVSPFEPVPMLLWARH